MQARTPEAGRTLTSTEERLQSTVQAACRQQEQYGRRLLMIVAGEVPDGIANRSRAQITPFPPGQLDRVPYRGAFAAPANQRARIAC